MSKLSRRALLVSGVAAAVAAASPLTLPAGEFVQDALPNIDDCVERLVVSPSCFQSKLIFRDPAWNDCVRISQLLLDRPYANMPPLWGITCRDESRWQVRVCCFGRDAAMSEASRLLTTKMRSVEITKCADGFVSQVFGGTLAKQKVQFLSRNLPNNRLLFGSLTGTPTGHDFLPAYPFANFKHGKTRFTYDQVIRAATDYPDRPFTHYEGDSTMTVLVVRYPDDVVAVEMDAKSCETRIRWDNQQIRSVRNRMFWTSLPFFIDTQGWLTRPGVDVVASDLD